MKPGFYFSDAVNDSRMSGRSDSFCGNAELNVFDKTVKLKSIPADDLTKGEHVRDEEEEAEN